jgi:ABC-type nickel/cobalt efflux system permease component RcnA
LFGVDQLISGLDAGGSLLVVVAVALLLGLRHAADPDHLVAVSTLLAGNEERAARRAGGLGLAWGLGHATSLIVAGVPVVFLGQHLPAIVRDGAELLVGVVIMALALRLVRRWRRGAFHTHVHVHDGVPHRHLHGHAEDSGHPHHHKVTRTHAQAYGVGLVHGVGGSAAVGVLLLASIAVRTEALAALLVFALGTAVSMSVLSLCLGHALARPRVSRRLQAVAPALGAASFAFGAWYAAVAVQALA